MHWYGVGLEEAVGTLKAVGGRVRPAFTDMTKHGPADARLPESRTGTGTPVPTC